MKDNVPSSGAPLLTVALIIALALSWLLSLIGGGALLTAVDLGALALFGGGVEASLGRVRYAALILASGLAGYALYVEIGDVQGAPALAAGAAIAAVLGAYLGLHLRARVLSVVLVPWLATIVAVPSALLILLWLATQVTIGLTRFDEPLARGDTWFVHLIALVIGVLAAAGRMRSVRRRLRAQPQID